MTFFYYEQHIYGTYSVMELIQRVRISAKEIVYLEDAYCDYSNGFCLSCKGEVMNCDVGKVVHCKTEIMQPFGSGI